MGVGILNVCVETECRQIVTAGMEGTRKRRKPRKGWTDEFQEYLKIMGTINWHQMARDRKEWRRIVLEAQGHKGYST